jgi:KaiC/GvpD/RAD55 family RecA-like ATPase/CheY-like chemotaxis protein
MLTHSGIAPVDARLGGMLPGRAHVLSGAPGTGKSLACLEFLNAGLEAGEQVAMLTHDDPADLLAQAEFLGIELEAALHEERFALIRYQLDFAGRFGRSPQPSIAFAELRELLGACEPRRIAIDSIAPIVDAGSAAGAGIGAMLEFLESCSATALLTYPGDFSGRYDRRLEPIVQRAAAVMHLENRHDGHLLHVRKVRFAVTSTAPVTFAIRAGAGLVISDGARRRAEDLPEDTRRRLLVLSTAGAPEPDDLLDALRDRFDVALRTTEPASLAAPLPSSAILVHARRDSFEGVLTTVRALRERGVVSPIAVASASAMRAVDRTRALRAGADDFLDADLRPDELLLRVDRLARLGRSSATPSAEQHLRAEGEDAGSILDERSFRGAVNARLASTVAPFFTMVRLKPMDARPESVGTLAEAARAHLRVESGDLAGRLDGSVAVFLQSARRKDVAPFVSRMRDAWRAAGGGDLDVEMLAFPAEQEAVRRMLEERSA